MITKKMGMFLGCALAVGALLVCSSTVQSESNPQMKLGGTFIGTGAAGLWRATQGPLDPAGRSATVRVEGIAMPGFAPLLAALDADPMGELSGYEEMVSHDTAKYNTIGYLTKGTTVKGIMVMTGTFQFVGPNNGVVKYSIKVYAPTADANGDGFPDAGATPIMPPIQGTDTAKRVTL